MSQKPNSQRGQAIVLIVFAIVALIGITALAIDSGNVYADRRNAQSAADNAALAGALALANHQSISAAANNVASSNGYDTISVSNPPNGVGCGSLASPYDGNSSYVWVVIKTTTNTFFGPVIGIRTVSSCVEATARAQTGSTGGWGGGNGVMALKQTGTGLQWTGSGGATMTGGIATNADYSSTGSGNFTVTDGVKVRGDFTQTGSGNWNVTNGVHVDGNLNLTGSGDWNVTGGAQIGGNFSHTGSSDFNVTTGSFLTGGTYSWVGSGAHSLWPPTHQAVAPLPTITDPLAAVLNPPANPGGCVAANYTGSTNRTINPGCFTSISMVGSGNLILNPGIYYVTGNLSMTGSGDFLASGVMIYMQSGSINLTGSGDFNISPMTTGAYAGLSIYMDRANTSTVSMTGSGSSSSTGTIYAPASDITTTGSGGTTVIDSQIVCSSMTLTGSGSLGLQYNGAHNYQVASSPTVELTR